MAYTIRLARVVQLLHEVANGAPTERGIMYDSIPPANTQDNTFTALGLMFSFDVMDGQGVSFHPWTNGDAIGYECHHPDGRVEFLYFNISSDSDDGVSNVFVYQGTEGDPAADTPYVHFDLFKD